MNEAEIRERKSAIEAQFGPWTGDNVPLGYGINTLPQHIVPQFLIRRVLQTIADVSRKPWNQLRILELGSLNGTTALEFASQGAQVVAIEGRESSNAHARFAAEVLGLSNVSFITDDVRNLSQEKYGRFDVVFSAGLLYHLPGIDACRFLSSVAQVCKHLTIIDTHVGLRDESSFSWEGRSYHGFVFKEHSTIPEECDFGLTTGAALFRT
jgi:SAM-dependent methyltransferase